MRDFSTWLRETAERLGDEEHPDTPEMAGSTFFAVCGGCGKQECVNMRAYENGDTGWWFHEEPEPEGYHRGVCGGGQFCLP